MTLPASTPDPQRARPEGQFVRRLTPAVIRLAPWDDEQPRIGTERCKAVMIVCGGDIDWRARQDETGHSYVIVCAVDFYTRKI